jgi:phosphatidate cytidylyltransferase
MTLNRQTFRTRTLTAAVFVLVMLAGLLWNYWSFFILFTIIHFGCWSEYQKLVGLINNDYLQITPLHKYGVRIAGWGIMIGFTNQAFHLFELQLHALGWWMAVVIVSLLLITDLLFSRRIKPKNILLSALGLLYISLCWGLMMDLRNQGLFFFGNSYLLWDFGRVIPCVLIFSIWINDTMAYIVGSFIGKHPLSKISPKKTWEGTVGGILLAITISGLLAWWIRIDIVEVMIIASIASITGTFGDLLESKLKRMANIKDSGHIMPGHGGFLDRFDSLLIATPFVWLYVKLLIR